jgi:signal transduction histidine kinase
MWIVELQEALRRGLSRPLPWTEPGPAPLSGQLRSNIVAAIEDHLQIYEVEYPARLRAGGQPTHIEPPHALRERLVRRWLGPGALSAPEVRRIRLRGLDAEIEATELERMLEWAVIAAITDNRAFLPGGLPWLLMRPYLDLRGLVPYDDPLLYAHELGLMRAGQTQPTGRVLVGLRGREAIRWLLGIEMRQAIGFEDPWRLSRMTAEALLQQPDVAEPLGLGPEPSFVRYDWEVIARLERLGVLTTKHLTHEGGYSVLPEGRELLRDVMAPSSPMLAAVGVLLDQDTSARLSDQSVPGAWDARAGEWVIETMAHGIRNALGPAHFALERARAGSPGAEDFARIQAGVDRALRLVGQLAELYRSAQQPTERFDLVAALQEAVALANGGNVEVRAAADFRPRLLGHRPRLVHAIYELVGNARMYGGPAVQVWISAERVSGGVVVHVDDSGPGVPEALRGRVLERGFSTRPEGTGQGLALLRDVVQGELMGTIRVEAAPELGGARFTLELPVREGGQ